MHVFWIGIMGYINVFKFLDKYNREFTPLRTMYQKRLSCCFMCIWNCIRKEKKNPIRIRQGPNYSRQRTGMCEIIYHARDAGVVSILRAVIWGIPRVHWSVHHHTIFNMPTAAQSTTWPFLWNSERCIKLLLVLNYVIRWQWEQKQLPCHGAHSYYKS